MTRKTSPLKAWLKKPDSLSNAAGGKGKRGGSTLNADSTATGPKYGRVESRPGTPIVVDLDSGDEQGLGLHSDPPLPLGRHGSRGDVDDACGAARKSQEDHHKGRGRRKRSDDMDATMQQLKSSDDSGEGSAGDDSDSSAARSDSGGGV
jgi:hypothetical protein